MCHAGTKSAKPFTTHSSEPHRGLTPIELLCPYFLGSNRRSRSDGKKLSISSTSCTPAVRRGAQSTNLLAGLDTPLACAPSRQTPSPRNSLRTGHNRVGAGNPPGLSTSSCPTYGKSEHLGKRVSLALSGQRN